jgi:hypothetical protein
MSRQSHRFEHPGMLKVCAFQHLPTHISPASCHLLPIFPSAICPQTTSTSLTDLCSNFISNNILITKLNKNDCRLRCCVAVDADSKHFCKTAPASCSPPSEPQMSQSQTQLRTARDTSYALTLTSRSQQPPVATGRFSFDLIGSLERVHRYRIKQQTYTTI